MLTSLRVQLDPLNVAVIGCGSWGYHHARVFKDLSNVNLLMISDVEPTRARFVAERFNVPWTADPSNVFKNDQIEAVSICTPTITHSKLAWEALASGLHVLVEKPMTNTIEEAERLIDEASRNCVFLSVGFVERFNPAVSETIRFIQEGEIGKVLLIHTKRVTRRPPRIGDVGVVKDLAIHDIDVVTAVLEEVPERVFSTTGCLNHSFEDYSNIHLCYGADRSAFVEANWLTPKKVRTLVVTGSEGIISVEYISQELRIEKNDHIHQPLNEYKEPLYLELENFTSSIQNKKEPLVTGQDGLTALQVCEAALHSSKTGSVVDFKEFIEGLS